MNGGGPRSGQGRQVAAANVPSGHFRQRSTVAEERDQEEQEYAFLLHHQQRPSSRASDSASIHFLTDDRLQQTGGKKTGSSRRGDATELLAEDVAQIRLSQRLPPASAVSPQQQQTEAVDRSGGMAASAPQPGGRNGQVDYSPGNFHRAKAAIEDAAARQQPRGGPPDRLRRVRQIGDTTVITEHRDPYSFYWQLDQLRKAEQEQARTVPQPDYVLEEEEEEEQISQRRKQWPVEEEEEVPPQQFLSPDSGVHLGEREEEEEEASYARPVKVVEDPATFSHYWHVDSGPPPEEPPPPVRRPLVSERPAISIPEPAQVQPEPIREPLVEEHAFRQTTTKRRLETAEDQLDEEEANQQPLHFKVRYLGQLELQQESDLDGVERSQATLNRAMAKLAGNLGRDTVLELGTADELRLLDEVGELVLKEPVQRIRCWAVGRENPREFAFVSREPTPHGRVLCHVFRCETPAKEVANALGQACDQLLRKQRRPDSLSSTGRRRTHQSTPVTPMQEPKRVVRCQFIGVTQVPRATGIEVLNEAVDRLLTEIRSWTLVDVHISPSTIAIFEARGPQRQIARARVRYLSFLGIGRDVKHCAFIVAQSADYFICYVFHAEPSAGPLAKTIEAACKLRYQKVIDAHVGPPTSAGTGSRMAEFHQKTSH